MSQRMSVLHNIMAICVFMVVTIAFVPGCSSEPKRVDIPLTANPNQEIEKLKQDLNVARQNQIELLSPRNFDKSIEYLKQAESQRDKDQKAQDIIKSLGMARAYLNIANDQGDRVRSSAQDIFSARNEALNAGAAQLRPKDLAKADHYFREVSYEVEKKRSPLPETKRADLQRAYLDLQVDTIKVARLTPIRADLETAEKQGAKKLVPKTWASARAKLDAAENIIETDRSNGEAIRKSAVAARQEANKLYKVTEIARTEKTTEKAALELYASREVNERLSEERNQAEELLTEQKKRADKNRRVEIIVTPPENTDTLEPSKAE